MFEVLSIVFTCIFCIVLVLGSAKFFIGDKVTRMNVFPRNQSPPPYSLMKDKALVPKQHPKISLRIVVIFFILIGDIVFLKKNCISGR